LVLSGQFLPGAYLDTSSRCPLLNVVRLQRAAAETIEIPLAELFLAVGFYVPDFGRLSLAIF
jgi:hypothetical protein